MRYVHDGEQLFFELNSAGAIRRTYTYYPGIDAPHGVEENGSYSYFAQDASGNVVGLLNSAGEIANRYKYAPFGTLESSSEAFANPVRFAGREYDAETQLYFNRARYYDPALGRFISEDPIGLEGGINQFVYAGNDPVNFRDPSGLSRCYSRDLPHPSYRGGYLGIETVCGRSWDSWWFFIWSSLTGGHGIQHNPGDPLWINVDDIMGADKELALAELAAEKRQRSHVQTVRRIAACAVGATDANGRAGVFASAEASLGPLASIGVDLDAISAHFGTDNRVTSGASAGADIGSGFLSIGVRTQSVDRGQGFSGYSGGAYHSFLYSSSSWTRASISRIGLSIGLFYGFDLGFDLSTFGLCMSK